MQQLQEVGTRLHGSRQFDWEAEKEPAVLAAVVDHPIDAGNQIKGTAGPHSSHRRSAHGGGPSKLAIGPQEVVPSLEVGQLRRRALVP